MKITRLYLLTILSVLALTITSCDNHDDHHDYDNNWSDIATVVPTGSDTYSLRLDDGTTLLPKNNSMRNPQMTRARVNYSVLPDSVSGYTHLVYVNYLNTILTKNIINLTTANADSIGDNRVHILTLDQGDDYLNIRFRYNVGGYVTHFINLVNNTTIAPPTDGKIHLEFRHNMNGDIPRYTAGGIVAFDLRPYRVVGQDSVNFAIKVNDFDGVRTYDFKYTYSGPLSSVKSKVKYDTSLDSSLNENYK